MGTTAQGADGVKIPKLKAWRNWKGLGQEELGKLAGVATATISRLEKGGVARPSTIAKLAKALNIDREKLLHSEPESKRPAA